MSEEEKVQASTSTVPQPGPTPYHETSQYRHWRYTVDQLHSIRSELNEKSKQVTARNMAAEKAAQESLGREYSGPPLGQTYLSVEDELLLVRFYCSQASKICRSFGLPESVESTALSYLKRFYLKNSVMEWHPKNIISTCLFLAAKTTNYPIPIDTFVSKLSKVTPAAVLDLEFLVAQSLGFEFWVRGADKALRGWSLELQSQPNPPIDSIQRAIPRALDALSVSRLTDAEFLYTPSQIALACWHIAKPDLVDSFLDWRYETVKSETRTRAGEDGSSEPNTTRLAFGIEKSALKAIIEKVQGVIQSAGNGEFDISAVKDVDKRLKGCTNPEKVPGTALYIKRKAEQEAAAAEAKAAKSLKVRNRESHGEVFGELLGKPIQPKSDAGSGDLFA